MNGGKSSGGTRVASSTVYSNKVVDDTGRQIQVATNEAVSFLENAYTSYPKSPAANKRPPPTQSDSTMELIDEYFT